jgi:hypothetical protein
LREQYAIDGDSDLDEQLECGYESIEGYMEKYIGWAMLHRVDMTEEFLSLYLGLCGGVVSILLSASPGIAIC